MLCHCCLSSYHDLQSIPASHHPEGVSWGYVRVVCARRRYKGTRPRRAGRSSEVEEHPEDGNMSVEDQGGARLGSRVQECKVTA
jgi:hypothetical protein